MSAGVVALTESVEFRAAIEAAASTPDDSGRDFALSAAHYVVHVWRPGGIRSDLGGGGA